MNVKHIEAHKHSFLGMKFCLDSFAVAALNHHHPHYSAHVGAAAEFQVKLRTTAAAALSKQASAAAAAAWALSSFRYSFSRRSSRATPPSSGFAKQNWNSSLDALHLLCYMFLLTTYLLNMLDRLEKFL